MNGPSPTQTPAPPRADSTSASQRPRVTRTLARIALLAAGAIIALLLIFLTLVAGFGVTEGGTRQLFRWAERLAPGLEIEGVEGQLLGELNLKNMRYEDEFRRLLISDAELAWKPTALVRSTLLVERLLASGIEFTQLKPAPASDDETPFELPEKIELPVAIDLRRLQITEVDYRSAADAEPQRLDSLTAQMSFIASTLALNSFELNAETFSVGGSVDAELADTYPATFELQWRFALPLKQNPQQTATGTLALSGDLNGYNVEHRIAPPLAIEQQMLLSYRQGSLSYRIDSRADRVNLAALSESSAADELRGTVLVEGVDQNLTVTAELNLLAADIANPRIELEAELEGQQLQLQALKLRTDGAHALDAEGLVRLAGESSTADLQARWRDLSWPLTGTPRLEANTGELTLKGSADSYRLNASSSLSAPEQPEGELRIRGTGDQNQFLLEALLVDALDGELAGSGDFRWAPQLRANLELAGEGIDPSVILPELPGSVSVDFQLAATETDMGLQATMQRAKFAGILAERPFSIDGKGSFADGVLVLEQLEAQAKDSSLEASGSVGEMLNLDWALRSPDLGTLYPAARGKVQGSGKIRGSRQRPVVQTDLQIQNFAFTDYQIGTLDLTADIDLDRPEPSQLLLRLSDAVAAGVTVSDASLEVRGTEAQHSLSARADADQGRLSLDASGAFGVPVREISWTRIAAVALVAAGLVLSRG